MFADAPECPALQFSLFQGDCCDTPPENYCTLCENGSENYSMDKVIPPTAGDPPIVATCQDYATRDKYLSEGALGICNDTARVRARAWCQCDGVQPACTLTCEDGNPPPDLNKTDPVYGVTCERRVYDYTTLTVDECKDSTFALNFDGKAFCCGEQAPNQCSVCPKGTTLGDPDKVLQTEFFGDVTCGQIASYAGYLPADSCSLFIGELLDDPFGAESQCCVASSSSAVDRMARKSGILVVVSGVLSLILQSCM